MSVGLRARAVIGAALVPDAVVVVTEGLFSHAGPASDVLPGLDAATRASVRPLPEGSVLLPGLVDLHCHGAVGNDYADAAPEGARSAVEHHLGQGTTSGLASVVSGSRERTAAANATLRPLVCEGLLSGVHLEGPYLSTRRCGAQDPRVLRPPDLEELGGWLSAADGTVATVTLAPELPGAREAASLVRAAGGVPAMGHTDADSQTAAAFLRAQDGPVLVTHLFNGMRPWHHRAAGPVAAALAAAARGEAVVELIADGVHLDDATVRTVFDLVGPERIALVTDAMAATGQQDGRYRLGTLDVLVREGVARLAPSTPGGPEGSIAGGTSRLLDVVRRLVLDVGLPLVDVVTAASATPAGVLHSPPGAPPVGSLLVGARADLVVAGSGLEPLAVLSAGRWVGSAPDLPAS